MAIRIYVVTDTETKSQRLIRASNRAEAVRFASRSRFSVEAASQDDLVNLLPNGVKIEDNETAAD